MSRGIEERACRNSRGQLKKKWDFEGCSRKTHLEFPWVKGNMTNLKILWGFSEKYILNPPPPSPPVWIFSGIAQYVRDCHQPVFPQMFAKRWQKLISPATIPKHVVLIIHLTTGRRNNLMVLSLSKVKKNEKNNEGMIMTIEEEEIKRKKKEKKKELT